jgi:transcriptional regulator with XRE-family HTH domain
MDLTQWMAENTRSDAEIGRAIGVTRAYIKRIRNGRANLSLEVALRLEEITKGEVPLEMMLPHELRPAPGFKRPRGRPWPSTIQRLIEHPK